jgi:hypothetical protein
VAFFCPKESRRGGNSHYRAGKNRLAWRKKRSFFLEVELKSKIKGNAFLNYAISL